MPEIRIKRGETLHLQIAYADTGTGRPIDLTNAVLSAQLRAPDDTLVATLTVTKTATLGVTRLDEPNTAGWPLGMLRADIRQIANGSTVSTQTIPIYVDREVTRS